jgi:putative FmdB family regulatory protein
MPQYEYRCKNDKCEVDLYTEFLPMKDSGKETHCPKCGEVGERQYGCQIDKVAASKWRI